MANPSKEQQKKKNIVISKTKDIVIKKSIKDKSGTNEVQKK